MSVDPTALDGLRSSLAADNYALDVAETGDGLEARITAGPDACADCLVPKDVMRGVLGSALGVPEDRITVHYPGEDGAG